MYRQNALSSNLGLAAALFFAAAAFFILPSISHAATHAELQTIANAGGSVPSITFAGGVNGSAAATASITITGTLPATATDQTVVIDGITVTLGTGALTAAQVAEAIVDDIQADGGYGAKSYTVADVGANINFTRKAQGVAGNGALPVTDADYGNDQTVTFTPAGATSNTVFGIEINANTYTFRASTVKAAVEGLQPLVTADTAVNCTENDLRIECVSETSGTAFTFHSYAYTVGTGGGSNGSGGSSSNNDADEDDAQDAIDDARDSLDDARDAVDDADEDDGDIDKANDLLDDAEDKLDDANDSFDDEDYDEAMDLADDAENLIDEALDEIGVESEDADEDDTQDAIDDARDALDDARSDVEDADDDGDDIGDAEDLLDDAEDKLDDADDSFDDEDYEEAMDSVDDANDLIEEALDEAGLSNDSDDEDEDEDDSDSDDDDTTTTTTTTTTTVFTRDLDLGATGSDVLMLQKYLNAKGYTIAASGAGSAGMETEYFGGLTQAALSKMQAAVGIMPTAGYFGPITRAYVAAHP